MRADALSQPDGTGWLWKARLPSLLADVGYMSVICAATIATFVVSGFFEALSDPGRSALHTATSVMLYSSMHLFPYVPVCAAVASLTPTAGLNRYLIFAAAGALALVWWRVADRLWGAPPTEFGVVDFVTWTLAIAACAYRSTARSSASTLMQREIRDAALHTELKQARLQLLSAQIEPHFLFNTLATVRTLARVDRQSALEMIDSLTRYLTEALPKLRQEEGTISDEFQLIEAYLRIQQIRMGSRLSYQLTLPAELASQRIPTMMLLTLVENALKHGIYPILEGGSLRVNAEHDGSALVLRVTDSGKGMSVGEGHGMGLANTRRRLTMLYGDRALLSLADAQPRGTVAAISIPMDALA